jgi:hypothetical protein
MEDKSYSRRIRSIEMKIPDGMGRIGLTCNETKSKQSEDV